MQSDQLRIESWKRNEKARIEFERFQATVEKVRSELVPPKAGWRNPGVCFRDVLGAPLYVVSPAPCGA